ncbi:MAG: hypothetical protein M3Q10_02930, partial [Chloroflexota bacterium]|nr:hypothetical protein [Chloroflexota bacterium]
MGGSFWEADEDATIRAAPDDWAGFRARFPHRTYSGFRQRRADLGLNPKARELAAARAMVQTSPDSPFVVDKKTGEDFHWRDANRVLRDMQDLKRRASWSQDDARFVFETGHPIAVLCLSDTHVGAWSSDHDLLERITDEILSTPDLYVVLLGDVAHMAIKLRGVLEVSDNALPPELQARYVESWLEDIAPKVLCAGWGNHDVEREEAQAGTSRFKELYSRRVVY